jgi:hypothetical protein
MRRGLIAAVVLLAAVPVSSVLVAAPAAAAQPAIPITAQHTTATAPHALAARARTARSSAGCATVTASSARATLARTGRDTLACVDTTAPNAAPPTRGVRANVLPAPDWCGRGQWLADRTNACAVSGWTLTVYRIDSNGNRTTIGQLTGNEVDYAYTSVDSSSFAFQVSIQPLGGWGAIGGTSANGSAICSGACTLGSVNFPTQAVTINSMINGDSFYNTTATAPGAVGTAASAYSWWFSNPAWQYPAGLQTSPPQYRCDNATPGKTGAGCVFPAYTPYVTYSLSGSYSQLARHIQTAQGSGLPSILNRVTDRSLVDANRATACPGSYPRPAGLSCDEYPFASSYQGAAFTGGGPRTWDWCQVDIGQPGSTGGSGYSVCMIDQVQNREGGSVVLAPFYSGNRVIDHDPFGVYIAP